MNSDGALTLLGKILQWNDSEATTEFRHLQMMARAKYDGYRDFFAGVHFLESLAAWLQQFKTIDERRYAFDFLKQHLIYVSPEELRRLVELFYPVTVKSDLLRRAGKRLSLTSYDVLSDAGGEKEFQRAKMQTLFMGLSDGARLDLLRHANVGNLTNDQFVLQTQVDNDKWAEILKKMRGATEVKDALFETIYLIDDFMATGTTFLRWDADENKWSGKLMKFLKSLKAARGAKQLCSEDWTLHIHHYIGTTKSEADTLKRYQEAKTALAEEGAPNVVFSYGMILDQSICIDPANPDHQNFAKLTQTYYSPGIETKSTDVGGVKHIGLGYGGCALPLVLEHNTPNNSVALLWAEIDADMTKQYPEMRPLFRRRQRHTQ